MSVERPSFVVDRRDPAALGEALLSRRDPSAGFDRLVPLTLSELADAAPLVVPDTYDPSPVERYGDPREIVSTLPEELPE